MFITLIILLAALTITVIGISCGIVFLPVILDIVVAIAIFRFIFKKRH